MFFNQKLNGKACHAICSYKHTTSVFHTHTLSLCTTICHRLWWKQTVRQSPEETVNTIHKTTDCENPVNSNTARNTPLRAPGINLWAAASIVFFSVDSSVLSPIRIDSISIAKRETGRQEGSEGGGESESEREREKERERQRQKDSPSLVKATTREVIYTFWMSCVQHFILNWVFILSMLSTNAYQYPGHYTAKTDTDSEDCTIFGVCIHKHHSHQKGRYENTDFTQR